MRIVASFLVTVSILGVCPCFGQWQGRKSVRVRSCPLADSLLGPMREGGSVQENYKVGADTTSLWSGTGVRGAFRFHASLLFPGRGPTSFPAPDLRDYTALYRVAVCDTLPMR